MTDLGLVDQELRDMIQKAYWKETTCRGKAPLHSYILKTAEPVLWEKLAFLIDNHGYDAFYHTTKFRYFDIDGYMYWHYDLVLNRALIKDSIVTREPPYNPQRKLEVQP